MQEEELIQKWKNFIQDKLMPVINNSGDELEGNIYSYNKCKDYNSDYLEKQHNILICGSRLKSNTKILEIGFNSGFSALLLLMSSDTSVKITCVDINYHKYTVPCYQVLKDYFGDRIELITGDSTIVLPSLTAKYDLIHIDGGHSTEIAHSDTENSIRLSNDDCILIMDDVNCENLKNVWNDCINTYNLKDVNFNLLPCKFHSIKQYNSK
jgi:predicted O-methyltransferase YrrM